jgi:hypothetical protein
MDAQVASTCPITLYNVMFGEASLKMFSIFDVDIFYSNVVNDECESEGSGVMLP